jgi:hypothetical protein
MTDPLDAFRLRMLALPSPSGIGGFAPGAWQTGQDTEGWQAAWGAAALWRTMASRMLLQMAGSPRAGAGPQAGLATPWSAAWTTVPPSTVFIA